MDRENISISLYIVIKRINHCSLIRDLPRYYIVYYQVDFGMLQRDQFLYY